LGILSGDNIYKAATVSTVSTHESKAESQVGTSYQVGCRKKKIETNNQRTVKKMRIDMCTVTITSSKGTKAQFSHNAGGDVPTFFTWYIQSYHMGMGQNHLVNPK